MGRVRADFQLGLRLSPERFGLSMAEILNFAQDVMTSDVIDWLDMSLWDFLKPPVETRFANKPLISRFAELDRGQACLGIAGKVPGGEAAMRALALGADFVLIGKGAILAHDFPCKVATDHRYQLPDRPVSVDFLRQQGIGETFIEYLRGFQ